MGNNHIIVVTIYYWEIALSVLKLSNQVINICSWQTTVFCYF